MSYTYWAKMIDPQGGYHLFRLHNDVIAGRAGNLLAAGRDDEGLARADAVTDALALARAELDWPDTWYEDGYQQELTSEPLHPTLIEAATQKHWVKTMPALG